MIEPEWDELIQDELDEANTPERSARLRAWLASHPEGRERMGELEELFGTLAHVERAKAPPDLRADVMAAIAADEAREPAREPAREGWGASLLGPWRRRPALRWAYGLAAAALVAVAGWALVGHGPVRGGHELPVSGTMAAAWTDVDAHRLEAGNATLLVLVQRAGQDLRLVGSGPPAAGASLALEFDPAALAWTDVSWPAAPGRAERGAGRLTVTWDGAAPTIRLRALGDGDAPLRIELRAGGATAGAVLHTAETRP